MKRKDFIRNGILSTGAFISSAAAAETINNTIEELKPLDTQLVDPEIGFNHLPNSKTTFMNNTVLHKASTRGVANHGWLNSCHSFSFANYYNPDRMHFGVLRVLNDDIVAAGMGFGTHPHDNMEIISIALEGDLEHKDSMGNTTIIKQGDIQVMSAGTGIYHSEYNKNKDKEVKFLQIWVFPNKRNVEPRYDQITLKPENRKNKLEQILSPNTNDAGVWIHQDSYFHMGKFDEAISTEYTIKKSGNGLYVFVLKGSFEVNGQKIEKRDGYGLWDISKVSLKSLIQGSEILLMEVPMVIG
ncbi:MAG: pirin family protein [Leadbetterella sp.]